MHAFFEVLSTVLCAIVANFRIFVRYELREVTGSHLFSTVDYVSAKICVHYQGTVVRKRLEIGQRVKIFRVKKGEFN